jgi:DNA-binding Lrp family transcriptional regulator
MVRIPGQCRRGTRIARRGTTERNPGGRATIEPNPLAFDRAVGLRDRNAGAASCRTGEEAGQRGDAAMQFFIFIRCKPGKTTEVGQSMVRKRLPEVQEIHSISGEWDLMVRALVKPRGVETDFESNVMETLLSDQWDNVDRTQTIIGYRVFNPDDAFIE